MKVQPLMRFGFVRRTALPAVLTAAALAALLSGRPAHVDEALAQSTPAGAFLDHFKCYRANHPGVQTTVTLADQFGSTTASVRKPNRFCNPVDKNGEGITDPTGHLMCHKIKDASRFTPRDVLVRNQFGDQTARILKPEAVCNPAEKDGVPLSSAAGAFLDHFKCYKAKSRDFTARTVSLADQFTTVSSNVLQLRVFCNPVDKNGSGIKQPAAHLACYKIKDATKFVGQSVTVEDQFGTYAIKARAGGCHKPQLLCVPSEKNPGSPTTTTTTIASTTTTIASTTTTIATTTTTTTSTTTTTLETFCCEVPLSSPSLPTLCFDAVPPDVFDKCNLLGGIVVPGVCDPVIERCVPPGPVPPNDFCCECPVPAPPFPHPQFCFEGVIGHEAKCGPPCVLHPALTCGPVTEKCGGSPSGAFLDPAGL